MNKDVWARLGIGTLKVLDNLYLSGGAVTILFETGRAVLKGRRKDVGGLDWDLPYHAIYPVEMPRLLRVDESALAPALPQVPLFLPGPHFDPSKVKLELEETDFRAEFVVQQVIDGYKKLAAGKIFFNGVNARLLQADEQKFVFQGSYYFDYLGTNLALDVDEELFGSRRSQINGAGALEPLAKSVLANATGVNGLMFSSDGYLVLQRRSDRVIVRPSQICPGFSGTIDKKDITLALHQGGSLADLEAAREMVEETGVAHEEIKRIKFLGATRELIRGGTPELFYAVDLSVSRAHIEGCYPQDREGELLFVPFGPYGRAAGLPESAGLTLNTLLERLADAVPGQHSLPLITNLVLWHRARTAV